MAAEGFKFEFGGYGRGTSPIEFRDVAGLLVDTSRRRLFVCDQGNHRAVCLDLTTRDVVWNSIDTDFEYPLACALSPDGATLFVTDGDDKRVVALNADSGAYQSSFGSCGSGKNQFQYTIGISITANGQAWIADSANRRVAIFDIGAQPSACEWVALAQIESVGQGEETAELHEPVGIAMSSDGCLAFVSVPEANSIHVFDVATRTHVRTMEGSSAPSDNSFGAPTALCVFDNDLYVCDGVNHRLSVFNVETGAWRGALGEGIFGESFFGVCVDAATRSIYASDSDAHRVLAFEAL